MSARTFNNSIFNQNLHGVRVEQSKADGRQVKYAHDSLAELVRRLAEGKHNLKLNNHKDIKTSAEALAKILCSNSEIRNRSPYRIDQILSTLSASTSPSSRDTVICFIQDQRDMGKIDNAALSKLLIGLRADCIKKEQEFNGESSEFPSRDDASHAVVSLST